MSKIEELFTLKNKVAIITGGTGLLGSQYARTLASAGANIILVDLNEDICQERASELEGEFGRRMLGIKADISKKEEVQIMIQKAEVTFGKVDILINNAAFNCPAESKGSNFVDFSEYPLELWEKSLGVNLTGTFLCSQEVIKSMVKNNIRGSIINVSSTYGIVSPDQKLYDSIRHPEDNSIKFIKPADYSTTKSGILNFTRYLASLYGNKGIRVNSFTPGGVWDNQDQKFVEEYEKRTPLGKMANREDYNGAILFLASDASKYMTGANLVVDGGWTCW